ncbi:hypothetical protein ACS0TY_004265 [Phlomoides rotata]
MHWGWLPITSDSQNLISALQTHLEADPQSMLITDDIRGLAQNFYSLNLFIFVRREGNSTAHVLAHFATEINFEKVWNGEIMECCKNQIVKNVRLNLPL